MIEPSSLKLCRARDAGRPACQRDYQVFQAAEKDEAVIGQIVSAQREELEQEIAS